MYYIKLSTSIFPASSCSGVSSMPVSFLHSSLVFSLSNSFLVILLGLPFFKLNLYFKLFTHLSNLSITTYLPTSVSPSLSSSLTFFKLVFYSITIQLKSYYIVFFISVSCHSFIQWGSAFNLFKLFVKSFFGKSCCSFIITLQAFDKIFCCFNL